MKIIFFSLIRLFIKRITGLGNVPKKGGFIVIANHESYMDPLLISSIIIPRVDKKVHYLARSEYTMTFGRFFEYLFYKKIVELIIMHEDSYKEGIFDKALTKLKKGGIVGIFPRIPETKEIKTGFVRLAIASEVPILPILLVGASKIAPLGTRNLPFKKKLIKPKRAEIKISKPVYLTKYYGKILSKAAIRKLAEEVYDL